MFNSLKNDKGSSLMLVLLVTSFVAALAVSLSQINLQGIKITKVIKRSHSLSRTRQQLVAALSSKSFCENAFRQNGNAGEFLGNVSNPTDPSDPLDKVTGISRELPGDKYVPMVFEGQEIEPGVKINNIYLRTQKDIGGVDMLPLSGVPAGHITYSVEVHLNATGERGTSMAMDPIKVKIITPQGSSLIEGCLDENLKPNNDIRFQWVPTSQACGTGYQDTKIRDEHDHKWNLMKGDPTKDSHKNIGSDSADRHKLCVKGVEDIEWKLGGCSTGYVDTRIRDDQDGPDDKHRLYETGDPPYTNVQHFCIKGITEATWEPDCDFGWTPVRLWDDADVAEHYFDRHNADGEFNSLVRLCVR